MSTQRPDTSNFQPWYGQRRPHSSLRPKKSEAPRWGQLAGRRPTSPRVSRKTTRFSPSRRTFLGGRSGSGSAEEGKHGIQYWRSRSPIGVPGPTRHRSSLSSLESIAGLLVITCEESNLRQPACRSAFDVLAGCLGRPLATALGAALRGSPVASVARALGGLISAPLGPSFAGSSAAPLATALPAALAGPDLHLGAGRESRQAVGHDSLARLEALGDDRLAALGARHGNAAEIDGRVRLDDVDEGALLSGLDGLRRDHDGVGLGGQGEGDIGELARPEAPLLVGERGLELDCPGGSVVRRI